jgi:diguanylate cyclase (GGDEF)-like protein
LAWRGEDAFLMEVAEPLLYLFASTATIYGSFGFLMVILRRRTQRLVLETLQDSLTGALNRRGLDEALQQLQAGMPLYPQVAVAMLDIDHFKQINDRYGHAAGDEVLRQLALFFRQSLRAQDVFARYGGEEFCLLLPGASPEAALRKLEQLRQRFGEQLLLAEAPALRCTFSAGLVSWDDAEVNPERLLHAADALLYQAKRAGRNRILTG